MPNNNTPLRLTNTIFATQSMLTASQIAIFTLLAIVAVDLSGSESFAGLPSTTLTLSQAIAALPIGILMGRLGRRFGLTISYASSAVGALLGVFAIVQGWFWLLLLSTVFIGAGRAGGDQSRYAAGDMFPEGQRAQMIGRIVFAGTVGAIFGPLLVTPGTYIANLLGMNENVGPWLVGFALYTLAATITFLMLRPDPLTIARSVSVTDAATSTDTDASKMKPLPISELLRQPPVTLAVIAMLISHGVMVGLMVITPLHMDHHNHEQGAISLVIMAHTLGMFGLSSVTGWLIDRYGAVRTMVLGAGTLIVSAIIAPLSATMPFLVVGLFLLGLGWNFGYIAGSSLLSNSLRGVNRTRMQGTSDMFIAGAAALGSLGSGPVFSAGGYTTVAGVGIVVTLLMVWAIFLLGAQARAAVTAAT